MPDGRPTPSKQPVPRWLSLKSSPVRARQGPGLDYPILWEYRASSLPLQVVAETRDWRKVCDAEGATAWVHRSVLTSRRTVYNPGTDSAPVRGSRSDTAPVRARLSAKALIAVDVCEDGWCRIKARRVGGWIRATDIFGAQTRPICPADRGAGPAPSPQALIGR